MNDLSEYVANGSRDYLFADDSILYRRISNTDDAKKLQQDLENLQTWEKDWQMEFHPKKCQVLNITNKKKPVKYSYTIHGHVLDTVSKIPQCTHPKPTQLEYACHQNLKQSKLNALFYN